ncbi:MAG: hypothetical protein GF411_19605 [Candidatus Lokiarchaeota archaeon]|nr:hypothetical protein [Candidatus Lokiarchaeota archaeon]
MTQSFVLLLRPTPKYGEPQTDDIVSQHFKYLQELQSRGILIMAGRFSDVLIGIVIFQCNDKEEANKIMEEDPAVREGIFHAELYPWRIALRSE